MMAARYVKAVVVLAVSILLVLPASASAVGVSDVNGEVDFFKKTITVDYNEPILWAGPFTDYSFPPGRTATVTLNGVAQSVTDSATANELITRPFTQRQEVIVDVPDASIHVSGALYPRHLLGTPTVTGTLRMLHTITVSGSLSPAHPVASQPISLDFQRLEKGKWISRKKASISNASASGYKYAVALPAGQWRVSASVADDSGNAAVASAWRGFRLAAYTQKPTSGWVKVSSTRPARMSNVKATSRVLDQYGKPIPGAKCVYRWYFKTFTLVRTRYTDSSGYASYTRNVGLAKKGYRVKVVAKMSKNGKTVSRSTSFVPQ